MRSASQMSGVRGVLVLIFMDTQPHLMHRDDRNGNITRNFYHYGAMISSLAKVMGLQSRQKKSILLYNNSCCSR